MREFNIIKTRNQKWLLKRLIFIKIQDLVTHFFANKMDWTLWDYKFKIVKTEKVDRIKEKGPEWALLLDVFFLELGEEPPKLKWHQKQLRKLRMSAIKKKTNLVFTEQEKELIRSRER